VKVRVLSTDDSNMRQFGIVRTGDQGLRIEILAGRFKGVETDAVNHLMGRLELDKVFVPGDIAFAVVDGDGERVAKANVLDHYRLDTQLWLLLLFCGLLLLFGGWTGARALLSFFFTGLMIWKVLLTCGLSLYFGGEFRIHGAVKPFSETLLYSGFAHLDLTRIFLGGIFLASSGAVMDLAMDVASAMREIVEKKPDISRRSLIMSGFTVGRAVVGTMTTTLLLAYTGSYTSLLLVFVAQGIPLANILNMQYVSAEILHTLVGSFGLVTVAPFTALASGWLFGGAQRRG
jgi:uncharacterized membrane protein